MPRYELLLAEASRLPWAILPEKGAAIAGVLTRAANGERADADTIRLAVESKKAKPKPKRTGVALLQIYGTITQKADLFSEFSGGTSTEAVGIVLDELMADASVEAIVLDFDSPGGSVYGVEELALKINAASKQKKIVGVANSMAASAAYWLLAQCSEVVVTPGGEIGSVGVYMMHRDVSRAMEMAGQKVTFVSAGERKTAGHPYAPLEGEAKAELQSGVDDFYDKFVRAVARGRKTTLTAVREGFGRGGVVRAEQAVREGMADRVASLDDVLKRWGTSAADLMGLSAGGGERPDVAATDTDIELMKCRLRLRQLNQ